VATAAIKPQRRAVRLLGRDVPVVQGDDGSRRADDNGKPASARGVWSCVMRAFGDRLEAVREAMEALMVSLPPEELNRVGFRHRVKIGACAPGFMPHERFGCLSSASSVDQSGAQNRVVN
jgi:hypothetical protein